MICIAGYQNNGKVWISGDIIKDALEAAAHYNGAVSPPFHILYLKSQEIK